MKLSILCLALYLLCTSYAAEKETDSVPANKPLPDWISPELPKPDADGWIALFDGNHLYGCSPSEQDLSAGKFSLQDGALRITKGYLRFNFQARDAILRATVKTVALPAAVPAVGLILRNADGKSYSANFARATNFFIARVGTPHKDLIRKSVSQPLTSFVELKFKCEGSHLTLSANGKVVAEADDDLLTNGAAVVASGWSQDFFKRIDIKVLDGKSAP
jgi:hypothetical protein